MIKIKKRYERLVNIGNYENVKVGVELEKDVESSDVKDIKKMAMILGKLAETVTTEEVESIKKSLVKTIKTEDANGK